MRRVALALALSITLGATATPASAGGDSAGSSADTIWVNPAVEGSGSRSSTSGTQVPCDYHPIPEADEVDAPQGTKVIDGVTHYLFYQDCLDGLPIGAVWVPDVRPEDLIPAVDDLLESRLHGPTPNLTPLDPELGWAYVHVPIDFRVNPSEWQPVEAYAEVTNPLGTTWVRATATPLLLELDAGGASSVTCDGLAPVAPFVAETPGRCSVTFDNASSPVARDDHFEATMAIHWEATWISSDPAVSGTLQVDPTETAFDLTVAEAKALVTCTGGRPSQGGC